MEKTWERCLDHFQPKASAYWLSPAAKFAPTGPCRWCGACVGTGWSSRPRREPWHGHRRWSGRQNDATVAATVSMDYEEHVGYGLGQRVLDESAEAGVAGGVQSTGGGGRLSVVVRAAP
jgi:hypothetical protein